MTAPVVLLPDDDSIVFDGYARAILDAYEADTEGRVGGVCGVEVSRAPGNLGGLNAYRMERGMRLQQRIGQHRTRFERRLFVDPFVLHGRDAWSGRPVPPWMRELDCVPVEWMTGFRMSFRTDVIRAIGFDEALARYAVFEDIEASFAVLRDHLIVGAHRARVLHYRAPGSRGSLRELGVTQVLNRTYVVCKHAAPGSEARRRLRSYAAYKCLQYAACAGSAPKPLTEIHVKPTGSDIATGSASAPLRTISTALKKATAGQTVIAYPGLHGAFKDTYVHPKPVTLSIKPGATIVGAFIAGAQNLTVEGGKFVAPVKVTNHPVLKSRQPSSGVTIRDSEFTGPGTSCLTIRQSSNITVQGSWFHDCRTGIAGPGAVGQSAGVRIERNTIERSQWDGIQFGGWDNVTIADNTIRETRDPGSRHNDAVQLTGGTRGLRFARNRLIDSEHQLMLIQDAVGPIDDVIIEDNVFNGAGAYAIQSQGATRAVFVGNTVWNSRWGGLLVRGGVGSKIHTAVVPTDTDVVNNVLSGLTEYGGLKLRTAAGNFIACDPAARANRAKAPGTCLAEPGFVDLAAGDLRLRGDSPARALAIGGASAPGAYR